MTQENGGWVGSVSAVWGSKPSTNLNIAIVVVAVVAAAAVAGVDGAVGAVVVVAVVGDVFLRWCWCWYTPFPDTPRYENWSYILV